MVGVIVACKYFSHGNKDNYSGIIDYMDRDEAIGNNIKISVNDTELNNTEKKLLSVMSKKGTSNIDELSKDKKLKNMVCYENELFSRDKMTRYDANYICKKYINKFNDYTFSEKSFEKIFFKTYKGKEKNKKLKVEFENEKKRVLSRISKLEKCGYLNKISDDTYELTSKAFKEIENFQGFQFTNYDVNKVFKLVKEHKYVKNLDRYLLSKFNLETKEGKHDYQYINKRILNNIKYGYLKIEDNKYCITEKGLNEADNILNPHKKYIADMIEKLELKSDEFKRKKSILDESYSKANYGGIIDYMDRETARKNDNVALFTNDKDVLDEKDKNGLKNIFDKAQKKKSLLWHDVISFDNKWLEKYGMYDSSTQTLDEKKLKDIVRIGVNKMVQAEHLSVPVWCADIHYNTDNIHVHISTVESLPVRDRGKRKLKHSILPLKSTIVNGIINNAEEYKKISDIIRKNIIETKKQIRSLDDTQLKNLFLEVYKKLPKDRRQWNYNYNTLKDARPLLDKMTDIYLDKYFKEDLKILKEKLKLQQKNLEEAYGYGKEEYFKNYYKNKMQEIKTRMGNTILKEIKEYDKLINKRDFNLSSKEKKRLLKETLVPRRLNSLGKSVQEQLYLIKRFEYNLQDSMENIKNQNEFEKLEYEIENEKN